MSVGRVSWLGSGAVLVIFCLSIFTPSAKAAESGQGVVCKNLSFSSDGTTYTFTAMASAGRGASISGYKFDFGDRQSYSFTFAKGSSGNRNTARIDHSYVRPGIYQATVFVIVTEHGKTHYVTSDNCKASVVVGQSLPSELTNVGPGNTVLLFGGVVVASGSVHHFALRLRRSFRRAV